MKTFGLIGFPLSHSYSPAFFNEKFNKLGIDAEYKLFPLDSIERFPELLKTKSISGLNVTVPYKVQIMNYLDELSSAAAEIGAVNTIVFKNGRKTGYNTDADGFESLFKKTGASDNEKALIFGSGGASKAVQYIFKKRGISFQVVSRTSENAEYLNYSDLSEGLIESHSILVNCTPIGMYPNNQEVLNLPYEAIHSRHIVIDLIYNPNTTTFMRLCQQKGAAVFNGLQMLHSQAEKAWELWQQD
jgi:shikimate dehydrogenase